MAIPDGDFACGDAKCSKRAAFNPFAPYPTFADAALGKLRGARPSAFADGRMGAAAKPPPAVFGEAEYDAPRGCANCAARGNGGVLAECERRRGN
mgnify:FL=1